jgi:hypothetical protein
LVHSILGRKDTKACALDARGRRLQERRSYHNVPEIFAAYLAALKEGTG